MDATEILTLIETPAGRITLTAWLINTVVRLLKEDTRLLPTVPAQHRRTLAFALGLVGGVVQAVALGATWQVAVITALGAPLLAIAGHHIGVDGLRGGRDLPIPAALKARKPPPPPSTMVSMLFLLVALVSACTPAQRQTARTVLDVARGLCMLSQAEKLGVSPEDVKEALCDTEEKVRPWIPHVLGAQRAGAIGASAGVEAK